MADVRRRQVLVETNPSSNSVYFYVGIGFKAGNFFTKVVRGPVHWVAIIPHPTVLIVSHEPNGLRHPRENGGERYSFFFPVVDEFVHTFRNK